MGSDIPGPHRTSAEPTRRVTNPMRWHTQRHHAVMGDRYRTVDGRSAILSGIRGVPAKRHVSLHRPGLRQRPRRGVAARVRRASCTPARCPATRSGFAPSETPGSAA
jgi:hypothetical protein